MVFSTVKQLSDGVIDLRVEFYYHGDGKYGVLPFYGCALYLAGSETKVGNLTLRISPHLPNPQEIEQLLYEGNVGYGIFQEFRGNGYAGRACRLAATLANEHELKELLINCNIANTASMRVIEKLGGKRIGEFDTPPAHMDENDTTPRRVQYRWRIEKP